MPFIWLNYYLARIQRMPWIIQQFRKNKIIFERARVPPRLSGQFWHQYLWFEPRRWREFMESQLGIVQWKKLPGEEFLCHS